MNYQKIYDAIILNRQTNKYIGYTELHHILPRSMGGSDDPSNLVRLSAREHFICHLLLYKIHKTPAMAFALHAMTMTGVRTERYTSHMFKYARECLSKTIKEIQTQKFKDPEVVEKFRQASKAYWAKEESKERARKARLGVVMSDETKQKLREANLGKKQSESTIKKRADTLSKMFKGKPKSSEKELEVFKYGRIGNNNPNAVLLNVFNYKTKELVESNITATEFGRLYGISKSTVKHLIETTDGRAKQCKGYYAELYIKE